MMKSRIALTCALGLAAAAARAQSAAEDEYTRYELLAPGTASFRILYDVTATTAGARFFFNPIRKGSEARDEAVYDRASGQPLRFELVSGGAAREAGQPQADPETQYIKVHLARPVPRDGEARLRIDKTYRDPKSYDVEGEQIVFERSLGIKRNSVVLPPGYELISCNIPAQVLSEPDGRIQVSFLNTYPSAAPLVIRGRRLRAAPPPAATPRSPASPPAAPAAAGLADRPVPERARQDAEIVYFLQPPETHAFRLYHDYTETRQGTDRYLNEVRAGSKVSDPSARNLDTGEALPTEIVRRDDGAETVVVRFPALKKGESMRLRIEETYADPGRYGLVGDELVWHRSFGRPANEMVLPEGWYLTTCSIPAVVSETADGRIRLSLSNPRPDSIDVFVKARRR
jgi:hypothetical protein